MADMIRCASCGAEYEVKLIRCPYCGTAPLAAEEDEYLGKLEDVRRDLEEYGSEGSRELKKGLGKTVLILIAVVIAIVMLIAGSIWLTGAGRRSDSQRKKEEFLTNQGITTGCLEETYYAV